MIFVISFTCNFAINNKRTNQINTTLVLIALLFSLMIKILTLVNVSTKKIYYVISYQYIYIYLYFYYA